MQSFIYCAEVNQDLELTVGGGKGEGEGEGEGGGGRGFSLPYRLFPSFSHDFFLSQIRGRAPPC